MPGLPGYDDWLDNYGNPGMGEDGMDIDWILEDDVNGEKITAEDGKVTYRITHADNPNQTCDITYAGDRMLFDGIDIETEDFMAYVGLCDGIDEGLTYFSSDDTAN